MSDVHRVWQRYMGVIRRNDLSGRLELLNYISWISRMGFIGSRALSLFLAGFLERLFYRIIPTVITLQRNTPSLRARLLNFTGSTPIHGFI